MNEKGSLFKKAAARVSARHAGKEKAEQIIDALYAKASGAHGISYESKESGRKSTVSSGMSDAQRIAILDDITVLDKIRDTEEREMKWVYSFIMSLPNAELIPYVFELYVRRDKDHYSTGQLAEMRKESVVVFSKRINTMIQEHMTDAKQAEIIRLMAETDVAEAKLNKIAKKW